MCATDDHPRLAFALSPARTPRRTEAIGDLDALNGDGNTVRTNTATGNVDNGIRLYAPNPGGDVAANTVNGNFLFGIDADVNPITVSKVNKAKDNGEGTQCNPASVCE